MSVSVAHSLQEVVYIVFFEGTRAKLERRKRCKNTTKTDHVRAPYHSS